MYSKNGGTKMYRVKAFLRKSLLGRNIQNFIIWFLIKTRFNNKIILFSSLKAKRHRVNVDFWQDKKNIGDAISPIIVEFACKFYGIDLNKSIPHTKHLFAVGSIITAGCQDCTIWGSGILNSTITSRVKNRMLDIRAVRGPLTRIILTDYGCDVPMIYGDPAILLPLIYNPDITKKYDIGVVLHLNRGIKVSTEYHQINIVTDDYKAFVNEIKSCKLILSSSLHGIIIAEIYGIPAILLNPKADLLKYYDYYYSTGRLYFPIAETITEALSLEAPAIPDFSDMQEKLLKSFPHDLWE